jgi:hypothetical protein
MDEYTMVWSDAKRVEAAAWALDSPPGRREDGPGFGTLGRALWVQRCLDCLLRLSPFLIASRAHAIVADLATDGSWLQVEPENAALRIVQSRRLGS